MTLMEKAAKLTGLLLPVAAQEPQDLIPHVESLDDAQARAVADYLVRLDRQKQSGGIRIDLDHPALDKLHGGRHRSRGVFTSAVPCL